MAYDFKEQNDLYMNLMDIRTTEDCVSGFFQFINAKAKYKRWKQLLPYEVYLEVCKYENEHYPRGLNLKAIQKILSLFS